MGYSVRVLPGLSSVQLLAAAVGRPWQDWKLVSAHGRACDPVAEVLAHPQVFFLTGGGDTPATLCAKLTAAGLGAAHALVGENLGTPAEAIRFGLARELAEDGYRLIATGEMGIGQYHHLQRGGGSAAGPARGAYDRARCGPLGRRACP